MPTMDDLGKLASQLYEGNPSIGAYQSKNALQWDWDAATALGFTSFNFYLWSGEEDDSYRAYARSFYTAYSHYDNYSRYYSDIQAVCIAD